MVIADERREVNVSEGLSDYKLECSYRGLPTPQIIWYKDDETINDDGTMYTIREQNDSEDNSKYEKVTSTLKFQGKFFFKTGCNDNAGCDQLTIAYT